MPRYFHDLFLQTWRNAEQLSKETLANSPKPGIDRKVIVILVYVAVALSITKYFGNTNAYLSWLLDKPGKFGHWYFGFFFGSESGELHSMIFWVFAILLFYLLVPMLIVKVVFKERLRDYGFRLKNIQKDYPLYILMLVVMLPLVYFASSTKSFQDRYPLFQPLINPLFPLFYWWQLVYFFQFVAVEFFFRGFILHGLKYRFGMYSIFIMTIPYCMIHFGKPFGETIAAILAGIVLGTVSLKSRSIVLGIVIHYSVAISMDLFALWREGYLVF
jgi:hypothetical protein